MSTEAQEHALRPSWRWARDLPDSSSELPYASSSERHSRALHLRLFQICQQKEMVMDETILPSDFNCESGQELGL